MFHVSFSSSVLPLRQQSTATGAVEKRKGYSPFQDPQNKMDYALARVDDLVNWARKVRGK